MIVTCEDAAFLSDCLSMLRQRLTKEEESKYDERIYNYIMEFEDLLIPLCDKSEVAERAFKKS